MVLFAVPIAYFATTRRQTGSLLAAFLTLPLVWFGQHVELFPGAFNHYLALIGGIACAAALNRGRRADWVLAVGLALALCSAGGGVAVAAACMVHIVCTRPPLRRWVMVIAPSLLWVIWWLTFERRLNDVGTYTMSASQTITFVRNLAYAPFDDIALGAGAIALVLVAAFIAYGIWSVSRGLVHGANALAWTTGLIVWAFGVANSRGVLFADPKVFRYRYVALGFVLLAVVPRHPIRWPSRLPITSDPRWLAGGALLLLVAGSARGLAVRSDLQSSAQQYAALGRAARADALVTDLGPAVVGDKVREPFELGLLLASETRSLFSQYGAAVETMPATADEQLVAMRGAVALSNGTRSVTCRPLTKPFVYHPKKPPYLVYLWSGTQSYSVDVRRFGSRWVHLGGAPRGRALVLGLPAFSSTVPWQIRANGACRVGPRRR